MRETTDSTVAAPEPRRQGSASPPPGRTRAELRYRIHLPRQGGRSSFDLPVGEHRIGSSRSSDIRLPAESISRQHALLRVTPAGLAVEDRGSKNGTFVDGHRVERAEVTAGSSLAFGSVVVEIEEIDAADVELALVFDAVEPGGSRGSTLPSGETASLLAGPEPAVLEGWLHLAEGFAERLFRTPAGDPEAALDFLRRRLEVRACLWVEWSEGPGPIAIAASGIGSAEGLDLLRALGEGLAGESGTADDGGAPLTRARLPEAGGRSQGLLLWGEFPGRGESGALLHLLLRLLKHSRPGRPEGPTSSPPPTLPDLVFPADYLPARSPPMLRLYRQMQVGLRSRVPILISGETGVGKERLASILHASSPRARGPWVAINCAAIPSELLEAELFGIGKGVATGVGSRVGQFQLAEDGTLFLDEIGEMAPALQAKLLRVLEEKEIQPLGGRPRKIDVRILAATNADLQEAMEEGRFRRDLFYRLSGFVLEVPPLRRCPEDIPPLIEFFARELAAAEEIALRGVTCKALSQLVAYPWPGNVRELRHEVRRLVHQCPEGGAIEAGSLPAHISASALDAAALVGEDDSCLRLAPRLGRLEAGLIREALRRTGGRQVRAARLLGISRNGLADKMRRLGVDPKPFRGSP